MKYKMPSTKWPFEICKELALKCKSRSEFERTYNGAYRASVNRKWMNDICGHMAPLGNRFNRCIYAYEFPDNSVYVGLTYSIEARNKVHTNSGSIVNNSAVKEHILKTGLTPKLNQLTGYIHYLEASKEEANWVEKYRASGFTILNKRSIGSLSLRNTLYTKEKCKEILLSYEYKIDALRHHPNIFTLCKNHRWHVALIKKMICKKKPSNYWNKRRCAKLAKSVSSVAELMKKNRAAYNAILKNGWKYEVMGHLNITKPHNHWKNKETCRAAAMTTGSRNEFYRKFRQACFESRKNKWMDEFFPNKQFGHNDRTTLDKK